MIRRAVAGMRVETVRTMARSAFEVYLDEDILYSKLKQKQFPNFEALVGTIRQHVETEAPVQVARFSYNFFYNDTAEIPFHSSISINLDGKQQRAENRVSYKFVHFDEKVRNKYFSTFLGPPVSSADIMT
jgi:hypothetical protein